MNEKKLDNWREFLPEKAAASIKEKLNLTISIRQIDRILSGVSEDLHGVLPEAVKLARKRKKEKERLHSAKTLLKLNKLTP